MSHIINATVSGLQQTIDADADTHLKLQSNGVTKLTVTPDGLIGDFPSSGGGGGASLLAFSAFQSAVQAVAANTATKLLFQTESFDSDNCFANSAFTAPSNGIYHFDWRLQTNQGAGTRHSTKLYVNGALAAYGQETPTSTSTIGQGGSANLKLNANDVVTVYWEHANTSAMNTIVGAPSTFFSGFQIRSI
jgi:hypothetical protein